MTTSKIGRGEVKKLLIAERKAMRQKVKDSLFMRRTLSIYKGMETRAKEAGVELDFGLERFRDFVRQRLDPTGVCSGLCCYCKDTLKLKTFQCDHLDPIARGGEHSFLNIDLCCNSCNWQKGQLFAAEFLRLQELLGTFHPTAAADVKRRLSIGGKWSFGR